MDACLIEVTVLFKRNQIFVVMTYGTNDLDVKFFRFPFLNDKEIFSIFLWTERNSGNKCISSL